MYVLGVVVVYVYFVVNRLTWSGSEVNANVFGLRQHTPEPSEPGSFSHTITFSGCVECLTVHTYTHRVSVNAATRRNTTQPACYQARPPLWTLPSPAAASGAETILIVKHSTLQSLCYKNHMGRSENKQSSAFFLIERRRKRERERELLSSVCNEFPLQSNEGKSLGKYSRGCWKHLWENCVEFLAIFQGVTPEGWKLLISV